ncbi:phosphoglucosamine mutase [soil metagenome]
MQKLFGTDGIRGHAGEYPLDPRTVNIIGVALSRQLREVLGREPRLISGRDTRESGAEIEAAILAGAAAEGARCESAGVITTPGVAYLTGAFEFDAGIVISASHNPYRDNGIKIFAPDGKKLDGEAERAIEAAVLADNAPLTRQADVRSQRAQKFCRDYLDHLRSEAGDLSLAGMKIVLDCANGAASSLAPSLFESLGASLNTINDRPDGQNINRNSGSTHLEHISRVVVEEGAEIGVAFDGDADRVLFVDETGCVVDGDGTLWVMAQYLKDHGKLQNSTVVATVMSNIGLQLALASRGIELLRANVGDRYVLEKLLETGTEIGGEQSGHIIFPSISLVGDGMMTALLLLRAIREKGVPLSQATEGFSRYPQILLNIPVKEKRPFENVPEIAAAAKRVEEELDGEGRLLLRYSGTEKLARVMIEGKDQAGIEAQAQQLAEVIGVSLG